EHMVDQAGVRVEEREEHPDHHHRGHEVRRIGEGLREPLEEPAAQLVESEREDDRQREEHHLIDAEREGVAQQPPEIERAEEPLEVLESRPRAAGDPAGGDEVLERDLHAVHRHIVEDQEEDQRRGGQQVQLPAGGEAPAQPAPAARGGGPRRLRAGARGGRGGRRPRRSEGSRHHVTGSDPNTRSRSGAISTRSPVAAESWRAIAHRAASMPSLRSARGTRSSPAARCQNVSPRISSPPWWPLLPLSMCSCSRVTSEPPAGSGNDTSMLCAPRSPSSSPSVPKIRSRRVERGCAITAVKVASVPEANSSEATWRSGRPEGA